MPAQMELFFIQCQTKPDVVLTIVQKHGNGSQGNLLQDSQTRGKIVILAVTQTKVQSIWITMLVNENLRSGISRTARSERLTNAPRYSNGSTIENWLKKPVFSKERQRLSHQTMFTNQVQPTINTSEQLFITREGFYLLSAFNLCIYHMYTLIVGRLYLTHFCSIFLFTFVQSHYVMAGSRQFQRGVRVKGVVSRHSKQGARLQAKRISARNARGARFSNTMMYFLK